MMDSDREEGFVVFIRTDSNDASAPDLIEQPYATCVTYEEARRVSRGYRDGANPCVIRFVGETGGGD
jgi:hypothetical protein